MPEGREIPYSDMDITIVRKYANDRVNSSSLRQIAARVGMRHTSLNNFVNGSEPYARIRALLCEWYLREHQVHPVTPTTRMLAQEQPQHDPADLLDALLGDLRGEARTEARMRITNALAQAYRRMGLGEPDWLFDRR